MKKSHTTLTKIIFIFLISFDFVFINIHFKNLLQIDINIKKPHFLRRSFKNVIINFFLMAFLGVDKKIG